MNMGIEPLDQKTLDEITRRLVKTYNPCEIYILEPIREDNIDSGILVVIEKAPEPDDRYAYMAKGHKALIGVDVAKYILVYTTEEFKKLSQDGYSNCYMIKKYGKRIYAKA